MACVFGQDVGEPCVQLKLTKKDPVSGQSTPITFSVSGDKFRMLLRGGLRWRLHIPIVRHLFFALSIFLGVAATDLKQVQEMMGNL